MADNLKIVVAGVPKKGSKALENRIENFHVGFIFPGSVSGKLQHTHHFLDGDIYEDEDGNLTGDSISLSPCDYMIKDQTYIDAYELEEEEVNIQHYGE